MTWAVLNPRSGKLEAHRVVPRSANCRDRGRPLVGGIDVAKRTTCSIDGCTGGPPITRGWCGKHYARWRQNGDPTVRLLADNTGDCAIADCVFPASRRTWCEPHYRRWVKYGTPMGGHPVHALDGDYERYTWSHVDVGHPLGCWEWTGRRNAGGYGKLSIEGREHFAHRWVYALLMGDIPPGLVIDHLCRNPPCVNPDHLEPVTAKVNAYRGFSPGMRRRGARFCLHGHELTPDNVYRGAREPRCRRCTLESNARSRRGDAT